MLIRELLGKLDKINNRTKKLSLIWKFRFSYFSKKIAPAELLSEGDSKKRYLTSADHGL